MAAEERHKSPSKLGRAGEERQKVPLGVALGVCSIGSESLTLPVTLVKVPWKGAFSLAEAERAELELLGLHSWSLNAFRVFRQITPQSPTQHIMSLFYINPAVFCSERVVLAELLSRARASG